nr:hypothetical protein [Tanacetum cinerariifolium]
VKSKDKGKRIIVEEPKPLKRQAQIEQDEAFARELEARINVNINWNDVIDQVKRKERKDNTFMRYQALKRKPVTKAQARKNMMVYLKNMAGFKMDFFRGMTYIEIRPIFENHYNSIQAFLEKGENEIKEEGSKRKSESSEQRAAKKQRIDEEVDELKTHLQIVPNDEDDVEDLEMIWKLVQERFQSSKPKNFSDDFLLNTLKTMFEKPNVEASIWRDQRGRYGIAKVKSWKLFESSGSESRPPMLNKENYVSWSSRLLRYVKSRPNGKLIHNSIRNGPYVRKMIPEPGDANHEITVTETFHLQTDDELFDKELKKIEADDQAIQTILLGLPEDIYAAINSCKTAQEIWLRVQQMMKGSDIGIQKKKANLFN